MVRTAILAGILFCVAVLAAPKITTYYQLLEDEYNRRSTKSALDTKCGLLLEKAVAISHDIKKARAYGYNGEKHDAKEREYQIASLDWAKCAYPNLR